MKTYRRSVFMITSVILVASGALWIWLSRAPTAGITLDSITAPQIGFQAPDFSLSTLDGQQVSLSDLTGVPIIINFWASWCPPCRAEMPDFQRAFIEYSESDLFIASINSTSQDSLNNVISFVESYQLTFPILLDSSGSITRNYNIHSLPTTFFVDRNGIITNVLIGGPIPLSLIRIEINKILTE